MFQNNPMSASIPDADPRSHRPRCARRESKILAAAGDFPLLGYDGQRVAGGTPLAIL